MARSYRKQPIYTDSSRIGKTLANRTVRRKFKRGESVAYGNLYRKMYNSYDVCDYRFRKTWLVYREEAACDMKHNKILYWEWFKFYKRK